MLKAEDVLALKQQLESEFRKKIEAYDIVLADLQSRATQVPQQSSEVTAQPVSVPSDSSPKKNEQPSRVRGVLAAVKRVTPSITPPFTREDALEALRAYKPEMAERTNLSIITSSLRQLVKEGYLEVVEHAKGARMGTYRMAKEKNEQPELLIETK